MSFRYAHVRTVLAGLLLLAAATVGYSQTNQGTGYVFSLSGQAQNATRFQGFVHDSNPLVPSIDKNGPLGNFQIIPKPDGTKFYILGNATGLVQSTDAVFSSFSSVNGVTGLPTFATMSPDGRYLFVAGSDISVIDTLNDTVLASNIAATGGDIKSIVISRDSRTGWVLMNNAFGSSIITFDVPSRTRIGSVTGLPFGGATAMVMSPMNLLYVSAVNYVYEIDPATVTITVGGGIQLNFTPGPLRFTADGTTAYAVNLGALGGSLLKLSLPSHVASTWPPFSTTVTPPVFSDVYVASSTRVFAFQPAAQTLWDVTTAPLGATTSALTAQFATPNVTGVALSAELPASRYLFATTSNGALNRIPLATNIPTNPGVTVNSQLQFVQIPPQSGATSFIQFNNLQTLRAGAVSAPLVARVLDSLGRPVYNATATFTTDSANGLVITTPNQVTNSDGWVQTTVTMPSAPASYTVTLTVGSATTNFTLFIPGGTAGGGGQVTSQVQIVGGNGQLLREFTASTFYAPLALQVKDTNNNPLPNVPVTFSFTGPPIGLIVSPNTVTDANGIAYTDIVAQAIQSGLAFQATTITGLTSLGGVDFTLTIYHPNGDGTGAPSVFIAQPRPGTIRITGGQGDTLAGAIQARVASENFPQIGVPIPKVGMRIANTADVSLPGPASCPASTTLGDESGLVSCDLTIGCQDAGVNLPTLASLDAVIGEYKKYSFVLQITSGSAQKVGITSGNNQSGRPGQALGSFLLATITDGCGAPAGNADVTWTVTQGSATLSNIVSKSDAAGRVSARVTLGQTPGPVKITVALGTKSSVVFDASNVAAVGSITLLTGNGQTAFTGQSFAQPLTFQVKDTSGNALPGVLVTFTVPTSNATTNPVSIQTDSQGRAITAVTAGNTAGTITVTATITTFSASASLTSRPPGPVITTQSFMNAASLQVGLTPCGLGIVTGLGLAPNVQGVVTGVGSFLPLPYVLATVSMTFNGVAVPIQAVSNVNGVQQVNFQTPCELQPGSATAIITVGGGSTTVSGVPVSAAQPGIFTYAGPGNKVYGAVIRAENGSYVTPSNPARRGETLYLVVTGLGQTTPPAITNAVGIGNQNVNVPVIVGVNNQGVPVLSAQYLVGQVGAYIVGFQIPTTAATGPDQPLAIAAVVNGQAVFGNPVLLPAVN